MPKFAVYYVPQADDPFYRLGSQLLGYDIRARAEVPLPSDLGDFLQPDQQMLPHEVQQMRLFYSRVVVGNWYPHCTLLNPYRGEEASLLASRLADLFTPYEQITVDAVCLLIQEDDEANWHIYREFRR